MSNEAPPETAKAEASSRKTWDTVFQEEIEAVRKRREQPGSENAPNAPLVGLAFSGGGIRSATFGLGVLEGLKQFGLLRKIDYLSTVSGGGYIGAWLSANCKRTAKRREAAPTEPDWLSPQADWKTSIDHLRRYSNYLSPSVGLFSADTWSMVAIWFRNTLLVQLTVILAIAALLLVPRPLFAVFEHWPQAGLYRWTTIILFILGVVGIAGNQLRLNWPGAWPLSSQNWPKGLACAAAFLAIAGIIGKTTHFRPFDPGQVDFNGAIPIAILLVAAGFCLQPVAVKLVNLLSPAEKPPEQINYTQAWVQAVVVVPMLAVGFLAAAILWGQSQGAGELARLDSFAGFFTAAWQHWPFPLSVIFMSLWLLSFCSIRQWDWKGVLVGLLVAPVPAMLVLHALLSAIMLLFHQWAGQGEQGQWLAYVWGPPLVLYALMLTIVILIGMLGRQSGEGGREWWSRFGAWLGIYGFGWMLINVSTVYGPLLGAFLLQSDTWKGITASGWAGTVLAGLFAGKSGSTGGAEGQGIGAKVREAVATAAPFVFVFGVLVGVATVLHLLLVNLSGSLQGDYWHLLYATAADMRPALPALAACAGCVALFAARVDINEFSLNAFYRSRLVRCYLGATRFQEGERKPQNFTGFDDEDDIKLATLADSQKPLAGPLHIVNCALNLGGSSDLALHTRHSAIFTLTPLHCGSGYASRDLAGDREMGYRPTGEFGGPDGQPTLGQAISVSGAAASPNMGYHTSPVVAFLLTLFNVRLGWWFPNPRHSADHPSPWFSLYYLVKELFGDANDKSEYLAISDGGHFENLAAYELLKRKCAVIIISDGECDPKLQFEGLGTLIRMSEVDLKAKIDIDVRSIRPESGAAWSRNRCAVGRVYYADGTCGLLIYLKASMTGHEETAVLQYKATHPDFPHETTSDQFYGEDQFESYRSLGRDVAMRTFAPVRPQDGQWDFLDLAEKLEKICSPSLPNVGQFTQHAAQLADLWSRLGNDPGLDSLDQELVAAWPQHPPANRSAFYLCSQMIQLMENVYLDVNLEETWDHPDNKGWRTLFANWANAKTLQDTWALTHKTYGLRFQYFCQRRLGLPLSS